MHSNNFRFYWYSLQGLRRLVSDVAVAVLNEALGGVNVVSSQPLREFENGIRVLLEFPAEKAVVVRDKVNEFSKEALEGHAFRNGRRRGGVDLHHDHGGATRSRRWLPTRSSTARSRATSAAAAARRPRR